VLDPPSPPSGEARGWPPPAGSSWGLAPLATGLSFGVWVLFVRPLGIVSLGSIVAALVLAGGGLPDPGPRFGTTGRRCLILALLLTLIIWVRHRGT